jgi:topoisomerase IV subunit A
VEAQIGEELEAIRKQFGKDAPAARGAPFAEMGEVPEVPPEAMIEREPITVICSAWAGSAR